MISAKHRSNLPQLNGKFMLTDGGMETTLIFHNGIDLPEFAAFPLLETPDGREALKTYYRQYLEIAKAHKSGFVLGSPTWRSNPDWGSVLGYNAEDLANINANSIDFLFELRNEFETDNTPVVIDGVIGPRGDGYSPADIMNAGDAQAYHSPQIETFAAAGTDVVSGLTLNYVDEAIGIVLAAKHAGIPSVISFTVETDGKLATGQSLGDAITQVDSETDNSAAYFMINCAHPTHFSDVVETKAPWANRILGVRANASSMSHAELDNSEELDDGNPKELGQQNQTLMGSLKNLTIIGGCCGTDHRHIEEIATACGNG